MKEEEYLRDKPEEFYLPCPMEDQHGHVFKPFGPPFDDLWIKMLCSRPWCSTCERVKMWRLRRKLHKYLSHNKPKHLWLWTRSVRNESRLVDAFRTLHHCNNNFAKQKDKDPHHPYHSVVTSYIGTYEITWHYFKGYNLHQHLIVGADAEYLNYSGIDKCWSAAAGYSAHSDLKRIEYGIVGAINYVSKYISKGFWGGLSPEKTYDVRHTLFRRSRVYTKRGTVPPASTQGYCFCCHVPYRSCMLGLSDTADHEFMSGRSAPVEIPFDQRVISVKADDTAEDAALRAYRLRHPVERRDCS